jgi:hypothetical protein
VKNGKAVKLDGDKANHNGNFTLKVTPGAVRLSVEGPRFGGTYLPFEKRFTARKGYEYRINADLSVPGQIAGKVKTADGKAPAARSTSRVLAYDAVTGQRIGFASVDEKGTYHLTLPAGAYRLKFGYFASDKAEWFGDADTFLEAPIVTVIEGGKLDAVNATVN